MYARHAEHEAEPAVARVSRSCVAGRRRPAWHRLDYYRSFGPRWSETKRELLEFLIGAKREGRSIVGYGAPGKGNTLLNYCGIRTDFLDYTVDRNPYKQGRFLPGHAHPDPSPGPDPARRGRTIVLILPWNLQDEIVASWRSSGMGRPVRRPDPAAVTAVSRGADVSRRPTGKEPHMKVVLFCGGLGMRLRDYSESIPKPMVPIGYRPILWHLMKYYAHFGHKDFILCLGYKADVIKNYFLNYDECLSNDFVLSRRRAARSTCSAATSTTGGSRSSTPGRRPTSASG